MHSNGARSWVGYQQHNDTRRIKLHATTILDFTGIRQKEVLHVSICNATTEEARNLQVWTMNIRQGRSFGRRDESPFSWIEARLIEDVLDQWCI
jgi:hypothetical protein